MIVIPYHGLFPPQNGGKLRCFHLLQELAREHEVHAIIMQPEQELREEKSGYVFPPEVKVYGPAQVPPPASLFDRLPKKMATALQYRWLQRTWRGPANGLVLAVHHLVEQILKNNNIEVVVFTGLSTLPLVPLVRRLRPEAFRIISTDNVDHHLLLQEIENSGGDCDKRKSLQKSYEQTLWQETHLARFVNAFFACSDEDWETFHALNSQAVKGYVIPNGVDVGGRPFDDRHDKNTSTDVIFCGSLNYEPNRDGLLWLHEKIWPLVLQAKRDARLVVVGRGAGESDFGTLRADPSVQFVGSVEDVVPHYHRAGVSVVPLRMGSGTRLKILEAMSLGNPVVSTRIGAQGINAVNGKQILLEDEPEKFAGAVGRLMSEAALFNSLRRSAYQLVKETYDWKVIGQKMNLSIRELLSSRGQEHPSSASVPGD
jgi:glycosyltransferase involved in cell wall biosynthesis